MEITDILSIEAVLPHLRATSKKQALHELARVASHIGNVEERTAFQLLMERERLGTTGIGNGIAIPHAKLRGLSRLHGVFARLDRPIAFEAVDEQPVDLIFMLLAPENAGADHLKALARVARMMRARDYCEKLRGSDNREALFALLTHPLPSQAA